MKKSALKIICLFLMIPLLTGCVRLAFQFSPSLIPNLTKTFFEECDYELAKQSLPADLKLLEGLLRTDPENKKILTSLCMGFNGYAMLFVEKEDPERASKLYLRARSYGFRALGQKASLFSEFGLKKETIHNRLLTIGEDDYEALFWTTMSWNAWINLNLDQPVALAQLSMADACLERVLEINPDYYYGTPYILMGSSLAARPDFLGGNAARAREYFEKAMDVSHRKFFLVHIYFARYYSVRTQNKELFFALIKEVEANPPDELKEACLINTVMKQKAKHLIEISEDLFF